MVTSDDGQMYSGLENTTLLLFLTMIGIVLDISSLEEIVECMCGCVAVWVRACVCVDDGWFKQAHRDWTLGLGEAAHQCAQVIPAITTHTLKEIYSMATWSTRS